MNGIQKLNNHSRNLFFSGLVISRFNYISTPLIGYSCFFLSAILYLGGYATWLLSVNYTRLAGSNIAKPWQQHYQQQNQHLPQYLAASAIGLIASVALITSFWLPITFGLISSWLFLSSNTCWWWAEHINITNARQRNLTTNLLAQRENYFSYTTLATLNSLLITLNVTIHCLLPASLVLPLGAIVSCFLVALTIHTFHYWVKNVASTLSLTEEDVEPDPIELSGSYYKLQQRNDFTPQEVISEKKIDDIKVKQPPQSPALYAENYRVEPFRSNTP